MTVNNDSMLEQFLSSVIIYFKNIENMNVYIHEIPTNVKYPCMIVYKVDVNTRMLNSYMFINRVTIYVRLFGNKEIDVKNKSQNIVQETFEGRGKIPILNEDGSPSNRFIRVEDIGVIEVDVDQNNVFCSEINLAFETTHKVKTSDFGKLKGVYSRVQ